MLRTLFLAHWVLIAVSNGLLVENVQFTVEALFWSVNPNFEIVLLLTSTLSPCLRLYVRVAVMAAFPSIPFII